ncbi:hypothetical protein ACEQ8H_008705 [Pleosporales sp. CAS-2024a]
MIAIQASAPQKCTPNLLPARVHHNGPINDAQRYWKPTTDDQGSQHAHFRGRHLHGTPVSLPPSHTGAVLHMTQSNLPRPPPPPPQHHLGHDHDQVDHDGDDDETEDVVVDTTVAEQMGQFDEIVVWEHGGSVDEHSDGFIRGLREWVGWAESMHVDEEDEKGSKQTQNT